MIWAPSSWKFIGASFGAALLLLASLAIGIVNENVYWARKTEILTAQAQVLGATVQPALVFQDSTAAKDAVAALNADRQIEVAGVYDLQHRLVAKLVRNGAVAPQIQPPDGQARNGRRASASVPVTYEGSDIGSVYLVSTEEPAISMARRHAGTFALLVMAVLIVGAMQAAQTAQAKATEEAARRATELAELNAELRDQVSRREVAEEALRQAQKMETLGQLTGGIAHDFNNLLQGVKGSLDLISRKPGETERVRKWAKGGLDAAERGEMLTAQLLAFSRAQKLELRAFDISAVIVRLRQLLPTAIGAEATLRFDLTDQPLAVIADATQLELAVLNLCINARDAMPNGGEITVTTTMVALTDDPELPAGDYVVLAVCDNGLGMPQEVRERAFDPFFTTKGVGKGTGLGLAQVYGIAKQSGGVARIDSTAGQGTCVRIFLPRVDQPDEISVLNPDQPAAQVRAGARVLIVDDDAGVRAYISDALQDLGYVTFQAQDGRSGLDALSEHDVDLMILDYAMPGMTGAEVAQEVRSFRPELPILFASGYAESEALEKSVDRPARLLRKPFETETLARAVFEALQP